ncbi:exodeoxyribonuclease VII large subunit [Elioraea sp. Yellowstone]|jgi:exodeoxyribonuclease VII large subunit|uniref:exodeoxyribonuclease VII large subunit n=1 Tax=Elioraea sp. Yellowstone TaxID=2592070 RepID=UPI00114FA2EA|nr:exodeoxyribonuclease VII large subunit [Elioraea sp. Yellowstone]TQF77203.1 exodeoxyribonuclease VII large subunit [Elioraea sp. Yellowstone]
MQETAPPGHNLPEFAVSELAAAIRRTLEGEFGRIRVRGEITELKRYPSGHVYLALKDENAKLAAVIWKSAVPRLGLAPENGVEVIATGRLTTYADRSTYQLQIERLEYAGEGALLARIEALRKTLAAEGLFDSARKRPLPRIPRVIGIVTSPRGAVIRDILHRLADRFPREVLVWPVAVQGQGAAEQIAAAIRGFNALPEDGTIPRPDLLIVARGGGSLEDLMAFNDEAVVRAAASSAIPLISAVGHETDTTLIDFAADLRAPTPTAAAELAVPVRVDLVRHLDQLRARASSAIARIVNERRLRLERAARAIPDLPTLIAAGQQRLDDRAARLDTAIGTLLAARRHALDRIAARLPHPRETIAARRAALELVSQRLQDRIGRVLAAAEARLGALAPRLDSVSYQSVLARGFALVTDQAGHAVTSARAVTPGKRLGLRFADGEARAIGEGTAPRRGVPRPEPEQERFL